MASSLSDLASNLAEGIHTINANMDMIIKECKAFGFKYKHCEPWIHNP